MAKRNPYKRIRQSDIAEALGVSVVTVSNALSGKKGVREELRQRILSMADELGYGDDTNTDLRRREPSASQLARQAYRFGVVFASDYSSEARSSFTDILKQWPPAHSIALDEMVLIDIDGISFEDAAQRVIERAQTEKLDGLMTIGVFSSAWMQRVDQALRLPWMSIDGILTVKELDSFRTDGFRAGYVLTEALIKRGHDRIGMLLDPPQHGIAMDLYLGFISAHMDAELTPSENHVHFMKPLGGYYRVEEALDLISELPEAELMGPDARTGWVLADSSIANFLSSELKRVKSHYVPEVTMLASANPSFEYVSTDAFHHVMTYVIDRGMILKNAVALLRRRIRNQSKAGQVRYFTGTSFTTFKEDDRD